MKTEEKAKRYDEALEWMREVYPTLTGAAKEDAEHYFPELKESENERMRQRIIKAIRLRADDMNEEWSDEIAWLERQKGQKSISAEAVLVRAGLKPYKDGNQWCVLAGDNIQEGICGFGDTIEDALYEFLKEVLDLQKEQKPTNNSTREKIISRATSEKQVVLISESSGEAEIGWDTRSLEDAKRLLECGLAFINKNITDTTEKRKDSASNSFDDMWDEEDCEEIIAEGQKLTPRFKELLKEVCHAWYDRGVKLAEQKEQKPNIEICPHSIKSKSYSMQKPAEWSEEDEGELQNAIDALEFLGKRGVYKSESGYDAALQAASWFKSLPKRFNLQP